MDPKPVLLALFLTTLTTLLSSMSQIIKNDSSRHILNACGIFESDSKALKSLVNRFHTKQIHSNVTDIHKHKEQFYEIMTYYIFICFR